MTNSNPDTLKELVLQDLADRHPGVTTAIGDGYTEAASVCLSRHHDTPCELDINCAGASSKCTTEWDVPDEKTKRAWANETDTTEAGAYGVSLATVELLQGLVAVSRAEALTGADYYLMPIGEEVEDLESCIRLEVSGTNMGNMAEIKRRLNEKIEQTKAGASNLPAIAAVVGFKQRQIMISDLVDET